MWRHKTDLLLFRSIAGTGDLLGKHALGILQIPLDRRNLNLDSDTSFVKIGWKLTELFALEHTILYFLISDGLMFTK